MDPLAALPRLRAADAQLAETLRILEEPALRAPSRLPDWSRAHVAAHIALNGEAFVRVLRQVAAGEPPSMYASNEARDADIATLAAASPEELHRRNADVAAELLAQLGRVDAAQWATRVTRVPAGGGMEFPLAEVLPRRIGELCIHHVDLDLGYSRHAWPSGFAADVVSTRAPRHPGWAFDATDSDASWGAASTAELVISGPVADLAWWLTGRGAGEGLEARGGNLPAPPRF